MPISFFLDSVNCAFPLKSDPHSTCASVDRSYWSPSSSEIEPPKNNTRVSPFKTVSTLSPSYLEGLNRWLLQLLPQRKRIHTGEITRKRISRKVELTLKKHTEVKPK